VHLGKDTVRATYGFFRFETPLDNLAGGHLTGPYRWYTAVGARVSFVDDGLTFGTNRDLGVCIHFREPIPRVLVRKHHSALTVTVADCRGLLDRIGEPRSSSWQGPASRG
jgi:hypothetical protein